MKLKFDNLSYSNQLSLLMRHLRWNGNKKKQNTSPDSSCNEEEEQQSN